MPTLAQLQANPKNPAQDGQKAYNDWLKQVDAAAERELGGYPGQQPAPAPYQASSTVYIPPPVYVPPVSTESLTTSANVTPVAQSGGDPAALGFDLHERSVDLMLRVEASRQASIDQSVRIATLITEMERSSPTRAAALAVQLGMPQLQPDLKSVTSPFVNDGTMGTFGGTVGTQSLRLPFSFSGKELTFLDQNDEVARIFADIGEQFGLPNILERSQAFAIPASGALPSLAGV